MNKIVKIFLVVFVLSTGNLLNGMFGRTPNKTEKAYENLKIMRWQTFECALDPKDQKERKKTIKALLRSMNDQDQYAVSSLILSNISRNRSERSTEQIYNM